MRKRYKALLGGLLFLAALPVGGCWMVTNPVFLDPDPAPAPRADARRLEADVRHLAGIRPARTSAQRGSLDLAALHIADAFEQAGCEPEMQNFKADHVDYRNVICAFGPADAPRLVIGAHYDVYRGPGADDNASGVAGVLELARMIAADKPALAHRLELVAFTLEEPPHFRADSMGSHVHARSLAEAGARVKLMVSVEMIGFFTDAPGSQNFPLGILALLYPDTGNFIGVVGRSMDREPVARVKGLMSVSDDLSVYSINGPRLINGIDFSDHRNYWDMGMPAVMITDTAFLRNPNYHEPTDTPDTLDYRRMALVVDGLYQVAVGY